MLIKRSEVKPGEQFFSLCKKLTALDGQRYDIYLSVDDNFVAFWTNKDTLVEVNRKQTFYDLMVNDKFRFENSSNIYTKIRYGEIALCLSKSGYCWVPQDYVLVEKVYG